MNISTQRKIDKWVGVLICRLFSLINRKKPDRLKAPQIRRILIILLSELGSLILSYPMLKRLKSKYPNATIHYLVFAQNAEALKLLEAVPDENIFPIRSHSFISFFKDSLSVLMNIRQRRMDVVIDCELFSRISSIFAFLSGAPIMVGFYPHTQEGLYRGNFINRPVLYNPYIHISRQFINMVEAIESDSFPLVKKEPADEQLVLPHVRMEKREKDEFQKKLAVDFPKISTKKLTLIYPGGGQLSIRAWPFDHYVILIRKLLKAGFHIGIIGLSTDSHLAQGFIQTLKSPNVFDLTGYTRSLTDLITLFHIASLLITNDGGPVHIAALSPIPTISLFGPETPILYGSLSSNAENLFAGLPCSPCLSAYNHRNSPCDGDNVCLKSITPEKIFSVSMKYLEG